MITKLTLSNFKSHRFTCLALSNLNVFAGRNGVGKSSIFQSMLLLRQSYQRGRLNSGLDLNGALCDIGEAIDAICQSAENDEIRFDFELENMQPVKWSFRVFDSMLESTFIPKNESDAVTEFTDFPLFGTGFQFLGAGRWGARESYPKDSFAVVTERQVSLEKGQGELVANFLDQWGDSMIPIESLHHPSASGKSLLEQTVAWEREISKNLLIKVNNYNHGFEIRYSFNKGVAESGKVTQFFRPENVGFGISYSLPIIVALLSAKPDAIILIENPEAHLHPEGQTNLAKLIARAAEAGIQVFIETHSETILNGILIACNEFEKSNSGISRDHVKMYYFDRDEVDHLAVVSPINIIEGGRIESQPDGFFDQNQKDLSTLLGF